MAEQEIEFGDYVKHINPLINGGLMMSVEGIEDGKLKCSYFYGPEATHKTDWFPISEFILVRKADGGFVK